MNLRVSALDVWQIPFPLSLTRGFVSITRTEHIKIRSGAARKQHLDGLVSGSVLHSNAMLQHRADAGPDNPHLPQAD